MGSGLRRGRDRGLREASPAADPLDGDRGRPRSPAASDSGDDEIVRLVLADAQPGEIRVVTSDHWLADRVHAAGATVEPSTPFRTLIEDSQ